MDYEIIIIDSGDSVKAIKPLTRFTREQIKRALKAAITKIKNKSPDVCYNGDPGF